MRLRHLLLAALLAGFAGVAWAQVDTDGWGVSPDASASDDKCVGMEPNMATFRPGWRSTCYYDFANTQDSETLDVRKCESVNVWLDPDEDGTSTGAEVQVYNCSEASFSANHCVKVLSDTDGDGVVNDVTLDGSTAMRVGLSHFQASYLAIDVTANAGSDDARVTAECH